MLKGFSTLLLLVVFWTGILKGETNICTSDDTECSCAVKSGNGFSKGYKLTCDRLNNPPFQVPVLTNVVTELNMFRTSPNQSRISATSLRQAVSLQFLRIEACSITMVEEEAFQGLYAVQFLNLANNNLKALPQRVFADLTQLQSMDLSYNSLKALTVDVFEGLVNLKHLDLSFNSFQSAHEDLFKPLQSLKNLQLENTLLGITVLPDGLLSSLPDLDILNLDDNKITQLQPQLIKNNKMIKELRIRKNSLQTVNGEIFQNLSQLMTFDIGENPFDCDCQLLSYKLWLDRSIRWDQELTGYCNFPDDLYGQPIASLPENRFICTTTTSTPETVPTTVSHSRNMSPSVTQTDNSSSNSTVTPDADKHPEITEADDSKFKVTERSIIIGSCAGAALLLIVIIVLILCGVKRAKRHTGTLKTKYIIRPDMVDEDKVAQKPTNDYTVAYQEPRVDGTQNGYIISNGVSGFYHTGSRTKVYMDKKENHSSDSTLKLDRMLKGATTSKNHNDSIFSIPLSTEKRYAEHPRSSSRFYTSPLYSPTISCTGNWQTPVNTGTWPTPHRVRFESTNQLYDGNTPACTPRNNIDTTLPTEKLVNGIGKSYYKPNYIDAEQLSETQSHDDHGVKYSTGSGDSGVHSNSSCPGIDDNLSPSLSHRQMTSLHELDQSHISIGSKKIRNETYV
ncbi:leucine-rich repeat transmembrane neuronal protein 3-like [Watersipora subatra]|uniref:leucine-rich repeat transmembrane neuronal protein 3-like n=1 Tax=Watersipora subatra TaxID=2589382 RepID=UPI00355AE801